MSAKSIIIKWGLIGGAITVILGLMTYLLGMSESKIIQYVSVLLMLAIIIFGLFEYRDKYGAGFASFGELFKVGLMIGLIISIISIIWSYIYMTYLDPEFLSRLLLKTEIEMENSGMSDSEVKMTMDMTAKFMTPIYTTVMGFASSLIMSGVITAISALVIKNNKPFAEIEE